MCKDLLAELGASSVASMALDRQTSAKNVLCYNEAIYLQRRTKKKERENESRDKRAESVLVVVHT